MLLTVGIKKTVSVGALTAPIDPISAKPVCMVRKLDGLGGEILA